MNRHKPWYIYVDILWTIRWITTIHRPIIIIIDTTNVK